MKENEIEDVSALILYGGWIESLYFNTQLVDQLGNEKLHARIGEQKISLGNLIGLIGQVNLDGELDDIVKNLEDLKVIYDKVVYNYEWIEPETISNQSLTIVKSKSSVTVSDEVLIEISSKISEIRNSIIGTTV